MDCILLQDRLLHERAFGFLDLELGKIPERTLKAGGLHLSCLEAVRALYQRPHERSQALFDSGEEMLQGRVMRKYVALGYRGSMPRWGFGCDGRIGYESRSCNEKRGHTARTKDHWILLDPDASRTLSKDFLRTTMRLFLLSTLLVDLLPHYPVMSLPAGSVGRGR